MGEGLFTQRSRLDRATRHPHLTPPPELCRPYLSATDATAVLMNVAVLAVASADTLPRPSSP